VRVRNVDVEKNGLGLATGSLVNQHECGRIIRKLLAEHFDRRNTANRLVLKDVGKHLQEVRFTTSKETGDPHADIVRRFIKGVAIVVKEADEVLLQFFRDDVLSNFLLDNVRCILIDFDDTIIPAAVAPPSLSSGNQSHPDSEVHTTPVESSGLHMQWSGFPERDIPPSGKR
jgi:hypothetical protein